MATFAGEPFRGQAYIRIGGALGTQRNFSLSVVDVNPNVDPTDQATWTGAPGSSLTLRFEWNVVGAPAFEAPQDAQIQVRVPGGAAVGDTWTVALGDGNDSGTATRTFHFDDNPLNEVAGSNRWGALELYINIRDHEGVDDYEHDTRDAGGLPNLGVSATVARGYLRAPGTVSSFTITKDSLGGTDEPATWAYPDSIFVRSTLADTAYENFTLTASLKDDSATTRRTSAETSSDTVKDFTWSGDGSVTNTAKVLADLPTQNHDLEFALTAVDFGGDNKFIWASTGHAAELVRTSDLVLTDDNRFNVDPSITVANMTRTSSEAVVNFGFHTVTGTFNVRNARSENLNSTNHANDDDMTVRSRDVVAGADQKTISSALAPNGSGTYSVSYSYNGPTATANRGTGTDGDTASHDTTGRSKTLKVIANGNGTRPSATASGTFVSLSDLLKLDTHPERDATLTKDTNPYANPGDGEVTNFVISADTLSAYAFVGDVNGTGRSGVNVDLELFKPDGTQSGSTQTKTTVGASDLGWTTDDAAFDVIAPAGNWTLRSRVELTNTGASGNYGDGASSPFGHLDQTVGFSSAYSADKSIVIHVPDEVAVGQAVTVSCEYIDSDGTRVTLDSAPTLRVFKVTAAGAQSDELAAGTMTQYSGQQAWSRSWTPSEAGTFIIEIRAVYSGGGVSGNTPVQARAKFDPIALALHGVLSSRM